MSSIYQITDLRKQRGCDEEAFTLEVPHFEVGAGQFIVVHGQSGCGKSTLLDILGLVLRPDTTGQFRITPRGTTPVEVAASTPDPVLTRIRRSEVGYILQTGGLLPFLNVRQNIELPGRINGRRPEPDEVKQLAERLGIASQLSKLPVALSGGQRQRVAVARAIAHSPQIILADEPTAAVDELTAATILSHLADLIRERGVTLVLVTHHLAPVLNLAHRFFGFRIRPGKTGICSTCHETEKPSAS